MAAKLTTLSALVAAAIALATAAPAHAVDNTPLPAPTPLSPAAGAVVDSVPPFAWSPVSVADHYDDELQGSFGGTRIFNEEPTPNGAKEPEDGDLPGYM